MSRLHGQAPATAGNSEMHTSANHAAARLVGISGLPAELGHE